MNRRSLFLLVAVALTAATVARSGHELPVYPSYYPHEIEVRSVTPAEAARLLGEGKMQALIGGAPQFTGDPPPSVGTIASLGSLIVVRVNPASRWGGTDAAACGAAQSVIRDLAAKRVDIIVHPYPVTPFHGDFLQHADRAAAAWDRFMAGPPDTGAPAISELKVKAASAPAKRLFPADRYTDEADWDVAVEAVSAADLAFRAATSSNGWLGPSWFKAGWHQAALLLGVPDDLQPPKDATEENTIERINLERGLVARLVAGCRAVVAGYTVRREYFNTEFTGGIENIAFDSIEGLHSPMFVRTVKLKDFPWNGWLIVGVDGPPAAAWNPIAGMTDRFGRLLWYALGDPALIPSPGSADWILNRITDVEPKAKR
jgi:hypothetical protein